MQVEISPDDARDVPFLVHYWSGILLRVHVHSFDSVSYTLIERVSVHRLFGSVSRRTPESHVP